MCGPIALEHASSIVDQIPRGTWFTTHMITTSRGKNIPEVVLAVVFIPDSNRMHGANWSEDFIKGNSAKSGELVNE
jgi:hypothetical protein